MPPLLIGWKYNLSPRMDTFERERDTNLMEHWSSMYEPRYVKNKIRSIKIVESIVHKKCS